MTPGPFSLEATMLMSRRHAIKLAGAATLTAASTRLPAAEPAALRLLILGGTSFLGPHLTDLALARDWRVTHFNRGRHDPDGVPGVETRIGDRNGQLGALADGEWDAVIDTSGYVPRHVALSARLLAPRVRQYVFVSSISVYAGFSIPNDESSPVGKLADETVEDVTGETYGPLKALCEQAAQAALPGRTTIIRPGLIVGPLDPTDRFTYWPVRIARGGEVLAPGSPGDPIQVIDVRDLAAWTLDLIERRVHGVFNAVSAPRQFTIGGLLEECLAVTESGAALTWADADFLESQKVSPWSDMPVWIPPRGEDGAASLTLVERAIEEGMRVRPLAGTLRDTLAWYRSLPVDRRGELRAGLSAEREREVLAAWHAPR
jgi:2'-hydroxyisoflavone reductase